MKQKKQRLLLSIIIFSLLGVILSGYLVKVHYTGQSICDLNNKLSCSLVNKSKYAEIKGIPVALLGVIFYSVLGLLGFSLYGFNKNNLYICKKLEKNPETSQNSFIYFITHPKLFLLLAVPAVVFSFYLTYAEFFLIGTICIACLISQGTILGIALMGYKYHQLEKQAIKTSNQEVEQDVD